VVVTASLFCGAVWSASTFGVKMTAPKTAAIATCAIALRVRRLCMAGIIIVTW
jgi:hypothetical protein